MAALIWGGFPAITKLSMASDALDAWDVTALRFGVAGLLLLPLFARRGFGNLRPLPALFLACGAGAPYVLLTAGGLAFAPGGHMGVITPSCMLLCSTLGSRLILKEPLTASRIAGALAITAGLVALGWDGLANHGELTWLGDAMFALGGLFWASYTIGSRVWRVEPLHATAVVGVLSMVLYLPGYAWLAGADLAAAPWREIVIQAVFQGVLSADRRAAALHARRRDPGRRARRRVRGARADVLAADRDPAAARDADGAAARRRHVRDGRHGVRAGPARPREMAFAAYAGSAADEVDHALPLGLIRQAAACGRHVVDHVMRLARRRRHGRHGRMRRGELQEELRPRRRAELAGPLRHLVALDALPQARAAERQIDEHADAALLRERKDALLGVEIVDGVVDADEVGDSSRMNCSSVAYCGLNVDVVPM